MTARAYALVIFGASCDECAWQPDMKGVTTREQAIEMAEKHNKEVHGG